MHMPPLVINEIQIEYFILRYHMKRLNRKGTHMDHHRPLFMWISTTAAVNNLSIRKADDVVWKTDDAPL